MNKTATLRQRLSMLILFLCIGIMAGAQEDFYALNNYGDTLYYHIKSATTVSVTFRGTSYDSYAHEYSDTLHIPNSVTHNAVTYRVTSISSQAFRDCSRLTAVTLPSSITSIASFAFYYCSGLTDISLPTTLTSIGKSAFAYCSSLSTLSLPATLTSIGESAFQNCSTLAAIALPTTLTTLGKNAFAYCNELSAISLPAALTTLHEGLFADCTSLATVALPATLTTIGDAVFQHCHALATIQFPATLTAIGNAAFLDCSALETVSLPAALTTIGDEAFRGCRALATVHFPTSLTTIGALAFKDCHRLTAAALPATLTSLGNSAFEDCSALATAVLPAALTTLGNFAFYHCGTLDTLTVASSGNTSHNPFLHTTVTHLKMLTATPPTASYSTFGITDSSWVHVPCGADSAYRNHAVWGNITRYNVLPKTTADSITLYDHQLPYRYGDSLLAEAGVHEIVFATTEGCDSIVRLTVAMTMTAPFSYFAAPNSDGDTLYYRPTSSITVAVTYRGERYDSHAQEYSGTLRIPDSVTHQGTTYPVTRIGAEAFRGCSGLTTVVLPATITTLEEYAFGDCGILDTVTVASACRVADHAFDGTLVSHLNLPLSTPPATSYRAFGLRNGAWVHVPCDATDSYRNHTVWGTHPNYSTLQTLRSSDSIALHDYRLPYRYGNSMLREAGVHEVVFSSAAGCDSIVMLTLNAIPSHFAACNSDGDTLCYRITGDTTACVTYRGTSAPAFSGSLRIPGSVTHQDNTYQVTAIGDYAFRSCSTLTAVTLPTSITTIGHHAFAYCNGLATIAFPDAIALTAIGDYAFYECSGLTTLALPDAITAIGKSAFRNCSSLTALTLPAALTTFGTSAFRDCSSLSTIHFPPSLTAIGAEAFRGCRSLSTLTLPNALTTIEAAAFRDCSSLATLTLPDALATIGDYAFRDCDSLTTLVLPDALTTIGTEAFRGCNSLATMRIPTALDTIGKYAFAYCSGLTSVYIPASLATIGEAAFQNCSSIATVNLTDADALAAIDDYAFYYCGALATAHLPASLSTIGNFAFRECHGLTTVVLPDSLTTLGHFAFYRCDTLDTMTVASDFGMGTNAFGSTSVSHLRMLPATPPTAAYSGFGIHNNSWVYVPCHAESTYRNHTVWGGFPNYRLLQNLRSADSIVLCDNMLPYSYGDSSLTTAGLYEIAFTSAEGCDSTVSLTLAVMPSYHITIADTVARGEDYTEHGFTLTHLQESGSHTLELITQQGCDSIITLYLTVQGVGIDATDKIPNLLLYPNPADERVTLHVEPLTLDATITLYDELGRSALSLTVPAGQKELTLNIGHLPAGIYHLHLTDHRQATVRKLVVR